MRKRQRERSPLSTLLQQLSLLGCPDPIDHGLANTALQPYVAAALSHHPDPSDLLNVLEQHGWRDGRFAADLHPDHLFSALHMHTYERLGQLGSGAYATVYKARNRETHELCAVKKMRLQCGDSGVPSTAIREVSCLQDLRHDHIVELKDVLWNSQKGSMYVVLECLDKDLRSHLNSFEKAPPVHLVKRYTRQLLRAMAFAHARRVMHRDLKPQNILVDSAQDSLKVADFGLARTFLPTANKAYSHEVVTLWYRAPELLLGTNQYSSAVDIWSIGCILAEMLNFLPIFSAESEIGMLHQIFQVLGTPSSDTWATIQTLPYYRTSFPQWAGRPLTEVIPALISDPQAADLLARLLTLDPTRRITATQALQHPWLREDPASQPKPPSSTPLTPTTPVQPGSVPTAVPDAGTFFSASPLSTSPAAYSPSPYPKVRVPRRMTPSPRPAPPPLTQLLSSQLNATAPSSCPAVLAVAALLNHPGAATAALPPLPRPSAPTLTRAHPPAATPSPNPLALLPDPTAATTGNLSSLKLHALSASLTAGGPPQPPSPEPNRAPSQALNSRLLSPSRAKPPLPPTAAAAHLSAALPAARPPQAIAKLGTPTLHHRHQLQASPAAATILARRSQHKADTSPRPCLGALFSPGCGLQPHSEHATTTQQQQQQQHPDLLTAQGMPKAALRLKLPARSSASLMGSALSSSSSSLQSSPDQILLQDRLAELQHVGSWE